MSNSASCQCKILAHAVRKIYKLHKKELQEQKKKALRTGQKPDSVWEGLLRSAAIWGGVRGIRLMEDRALYDLVSWRALSALSKSERRKIIRRALKGARVRWAERKVSYVLANFENLRREGGPHAVKRRLDSMCRDEIIRFLGTFRGIGPKYGRNMMMDGYHNAFRDSIAIDQRIQKILIAITASNSAANVSASLTLTVTDTPPVVTTDSWRLANFGASAIDLTIAGDMADPDGDGYTNLGEFTFGTNPLDPVSTGIWEI